MSRQVLSRKVFWFLVAALILPIFIAFELWHASRAQTPQGVYIHQLSNGETVEVYAEEGARFNGRLVENVAHINLTCDASATGISDMAVAPSIISDATNTTPIVITSVAHGLSENFFVFIDEVEGNTAANGFRKIKNVTTNNFEITDYGGTEIAGNGAYTTGGEALPSFVFDPGDKIAVIKRLCGYAHATSYNSEGYLNVSELQKGITLEVRNDTSLVFDVTRGAPIQIWLDWSLHSGVDALVSTGGMALRRQCQLRWTFKEGFGPLRVDGTKNQVLVMVIRDDLSGLLGQKMNVQGFIK